MFGIVSQIAPPIDKKMSQSVYAYRLRKGGSSTRLFEHRDLRFLRRTTRRRAAVFRDWYEQWPAFQAEGIRLYLRRGYKFLSVSDIAAFYENISLPVLRDLLLSYLPRQQRTINLLMRVLQAWAWPTEAGFLVPRGIPQGPDFSGFLANVYLMPLDLSLERYGKKHPIQYVRYVDDVRIFSRSEGDARAVLGIMNETLRSLQLNVQGSKTEIFRGKEIEKELVDSLFERIDALADKATKRRLRPWECNRIENRARKFLSLMLQRGIGDKRDNRRLRRLLTALTAIRSPLAVRECLRSISRDPEHRLNDKVRKYLVCFPRKPSIPRRVLSLLSSGLVAHYPSQESELVKVLKLNGSDPSDLNKIARYILTSSKHWHVKQQMLLALCNIPADPQTVNVTWGLFQKSDNSDLRRAALLCLLCSQADRVRELIPALYREVDPKLLRTARYLWSLSHDNQVAQRELSSLSQIDDDRLMVQKLYKWTMFVQLRTPNLRKAARAVLVKWNKICRRAHLKKRIRTHLIAFQP